MNDENENYCEEDEEGYYYEDADEDLSEEKNERQKLSKAEIILVIAIVGVFLILMLAFVYAIMGTLSSLYMHS